MSPPRILIADHEIDSRELLIDCLKDGSSEVIGVCDGEEALAAVNTRNIDVLIADITRWDVINVDLLSLSWKKLTEFSHVASPADYAIWITILNRSPHCCIYVRRMVF